MPYFLHIVSSTLSLSAASVHFDVKSDLNCLYHSLTVWSIFFFCPQIKCFRDIIFSLTNKKLHSIVIKLQFGYQWIKWKIQLKYLNILLYQILLSSRDLFPILVCDIDLIMSNDPQICSQLLSVGTVSLPGCRIDMDQRSLCPNLSIRQWS